WELYDYVTAVVAEWPQGPPVWVDTIGITGANPTSEVVVVTYGVAVDPDIPVHYNIYWSETSPIDFDNANVEQDFDGSPYIVSGLLGGNTYHFAVRAEDSIGLEDTNTFELPATVLSNPVEEWSYQTQGVIFSSPTFVDLNGDNIEDVVVGSQDSKVHAISGADGTELWVFQAGDWVDSSPAIAYQVTVSMTPDIIVGSYDWNVYRLDGDDGSELWSFTTGGIVHASPALADLSDDGIADVVIGSFDGSLYAIDGTTGMELWSYAASGPIYSSAALGDITGDGIPDCFVGARDNSIHAVDGTDGSLIWTFPTNDWVNSSPALGHFDGDDVLDVAATSLDGNLYVISGATGEEIFKFSTTNKCWTSPAIGFINGDLVPDIVFGSDDFKLYAISGADGSDSCRRAVCKRRARHRHGQDTDD
ncbi:MAG: PQQ-like beta-propeller repeat protein, partial [Proteobacteria bacterium]|nr:PQQ-like beta-propeller repeat protein [Pseudomonadota bacterium]